MSKNNLRMGKSLSELQALKNYIKGMLVNQKRTDAALLRQLCVDMTEKEVADIAHLINSDMFISYISES